MEMRSLLWTAVADPGAEHLVLGQIPGGWLAEGTIVGAADGAPFSARYTVRCDTRWQVREVAVQVRRADGEHALQMRADGAGGWRAGAGTTLPALAGCLDVDISATPFTNTLPIRRLALPVGAAATIRVAYVAAHALDCSAADQRYTHLEARADGTSRYLYEGLSTGYHAEIEVDGDGLVLDYPGLWRRAAL
jgi:hypothetical protein